MLRFSPLVLVLALTGCNEPKSTMLVPSAIGGRCRVEVGEIRSNVRVRCGGPCATGALEEGTCADGRQACANQCDVYQDVEVCYLADRVVSLMTIDREFGNFKWCLFPDPNAPLPPRTRARR